MGSNEKQQTDDIHESDLAEETRRDDAEPREHWEMTAAGAVPAPDTGVEPRMDADGSHQVLEDGLRSEMTAEGAWLEPEGTDTQMTGSGAAPARRTQGAERRTDR